MIEYSLIYSDRRTLSLSVRGGVVTVRAPKRATRELIDSFVKKHSLWIERNLEAEKKRIEKDTSLSEKQILDLKREAKLYLKEKTECFSQIMGLKYGRITITSAQTRFGSCSSKGNISYSYRLMLYPEPAREYVVVHELAHLKEMNHSRKFYDIVEAVLPDYKDRKRMLK